MPNLDLLNRQFEDHQDFIVISCEELQNFEALRESWKLRFASTKSEDEFLNNAHNSSGITFEVSYFEGVIKKILASSCEVSEIEKFRVTVDKPIRLVMGLPRPQMLKRVLEHLAVLPICELVIVMSDLSDKSFLLSNILRNEELIEYVKYGIRQSGIPYFPNIRLIFDRAEVNSCLISSFLGAKFYGEVDTELNFKDILSLPVREKEDIRENGLSIFIGPERGWSNREKELFEKFAIHPISLGPTTYRVDTSVIAISSQLSLIWDLI